MLRVVANLTIVTPNDQENQRVPDPHHFEADVPTTWAGMDAIDQFERETLEGYRDLHVSWWKVEVMFLD